MVGYFPIWNDNDISQINMTNFIAIVYFVTQQCVLYHVQLSYHSCLQQLDINMSVIPINHILSSAN